MTADKRIESLGKLWAYDLWQEARHIAQQDGRMKLNVDDVDRAACKLIQAPRLAVCLCEHLGPMVTQPDKPRSGSRLY